MTNLLDKFNLDRLVLDKKKLLFVVLISLAVIFLDISYLLKMQLAGLRKAGPKVSKLKNDLSNLNIGLQSMESLKNKEKAEKQTNAASLKKIISEGKITALLQDISETAKKNGIRISQIKHAADPGGAKQIGTEKLLSYLISLDFICDYHTLGKFLNELENGQIFVSVQDLRITPGEQDAIKQKVYVGLRTYVRK